MNKKTIYFDMFHVFVNNRIDGNVKCTLIIIMRENRLSDLDMKVGKKQESHFNSHKVIVMDRYSARWRSGRQCAASSFSRKSKNRRRK